MPAFDPLPPLVTGQTYDLLFTINSSLLVLTWGPLYAVYHVGSTSIEGMVAKPIIDILVCPNDDVPVEDVIPDLERIGYKNLGDGSRPGRYFLSSGDKPHETFYVHLCHEGNQVAQDQLLFQKIERTNPVICSNR